MMCSPQAYVCFEKPLKACASPSFLSSIPYQIPTSPRSYESHSVLSFTNLYTSALLGVNNALRAGKETLAELLLCVAAVQAALPLGSPPPLLNKSVASLSEVTHLVVLHALEPVAEAGADKTVDGVGEEALAVEEGAHLDTELP